MATKLIIITVLLFIIASLGSALYNLVKGKDRSIRTVKALTIRITLSIALFFFLIIAFAVGWITPHGLS